MCLYELHCHAVSVMQSSMIEAMVCIYREVSAAVRTPTVMRVMNQDAGT